MNPYEKLPGDPNLPPGVNKKELEEGNDSSRDDNSPDDANDIDDGKRYCWHCDERYPIDELHEATITLKGYESKIEIVLCDDCLPLC